MARILDEGRVARLLDEIGDRRREKRKKHACRGRLIIIKFGRIQRVWRLLWQLVSGLLVVKKWTLDIFLAFSEDGVITAEEENYISRWLVSRLFVVHCVPDAVVTRVGIPCS